MKPIKTINTLNLRQKNYLKSKFKIKKYNDLYLKILKNLKEAMKQLTDSRISKKCKYKIWDVVVCVIISVLCGKKDWEEIHDFVQGKYSFFRQFLKMTGGIPSAKTYERIMSTINYKELENITLTFFKTITTDIYEGIEILNFDGRVNNGSKRNRTYKADPISPLNMLNVYSNKYQLCIFSEIIDEKTNEIPTVEEILKKLNVKKTIVTWDALNTQINNVKAAINAGANYVVPIKGNHGIFLEDLKLFFDEEQEEYIIAGKQNTGYLKECEYKNGCSITYEYFQTEDVDWLENCKDWECLNSIGMVKKTISKQIIDSQDKKIKTTTTVEKRYYISSLLLNIKLFSTSIRKHWNVENKLHWHLDFTFRQDDNRTLNKNALANLEIINKFCLGILKRVQKYYGISLKRIMGKMSLNIEENFLELLALLALSDGIEKEN